MSSRYLEILRDRVVFFDGGMGTQVQARELSAEDYGGKRWDGCIDYLSLTRPDVVEDIHSTYFDAGADVVETNSFQASRTRLEEWGLGERTVELNRAAAAIARRVADRYAAADGRPRFVAGSMGPSGFLPSSEDPELGKLSQAELELSFRDQAQGLLEGGADLLILETCQDMLEMKAQILAARNAMGITGRKVPIQSSITLDPTGRMLLGTDYRGALATLEAMHVDVIGLNCSTGPDLMRDAIRYLCENASTPVHCIPNAGLPINDGGRTLYPMRPAPFAESLREFVLDFGVNIVGGCCGTTPEHIQRIVAAVGHGTRPRPRPWAQSLVRVERHDRGGVGAGAPAAADRRTAEHAGLAQGQATGARERARGHGPDRARAGRGRRARARRVPGAHRKNRRGWTNARAGQEAGAVGGGAAVH